MKILPREKRWNFIDLLCIDLFLIESYYIKILISILQELIQLYSREW